MSTLFTDIYSRAINEFDDPFIKSAYGTTINFFRIMSGYLLNAVPLFMIPEIMIQKLDSIIKPIGYTELFSGDGDTNNFVLTTTPLADSYFLYKVGSVQVTGDYDTESNSITLDTAPILGTNNISIEWYYAGSFTNTLTSLEERILSYLWVLNWAEKEKNYSLDIQRVLNDTDFRLSNEATNLNAKSNWYDGLREEAENLMKKYSWNLYISALKTKYGLS